MPTTSHRPTTSRSQPTAKCRRSNVNRRRVAATEAFFKGLCLVESRKGGLTAKESPVHDWQSTCSHCCCLPQQYRLNMKIAFRLSKSQRKWDMTETKICPRTPGMGHHPHAKKRPASSRGVCANCGTAAQIASTKASALCACQQTHCETCNSQPAWQAKPQRDTTTLSARTWHGRVSHLSGCHPCHLFVLTKIKHAHHHTGVPAPIHRLGNQSKAPPRRSLTGKKSCSRTLFFQKSPRTLHVFT